MKKRLLLIASLFLIVATQAQTINRVEYFIDTDPGFGNGINVVVPQDTVISNFLFNVDLSSLSEGLHSMYIRSADANGKWSITRNQYLYKFPFAPNNNVLPSITQLEYFIDNDPGFGNAINVPISSDSVINAFLINIPLTTLSSGLHVLSIRSKDANGQWSITRNQYLYKFPFAPNNNVLPAITQVEYFIDNDPGFGNAINVPISSDSVINAFLFNIPLTTLSNGLHVLSIRSKDVNGQWSITRNQYLYKFPLAPNNNILPAITQLEYFIDNDPGFGNAINVPISSDSVINAFLFNIPLTTLSSGLHVLSIRSKDANGQWSITRNQYLYKFPLAVNNNVLPAITQVEYFIDNDPGFGNAINVPVTSDSVINAFLFNIPLTTLSSGLHVLSIRSKDANGQWSITRNQYLYKFPLAVNNNVLPAITQLEYYIDTDPGFGNAINVPVASDSVINSFLFNIPLTSLSSGLHVLSIRSKDANAQWSITRNQYLYKFPLAPNNNVLPAITQVEYFIDNDPGFGNAINVPVTSDSVINAFLFNIPLTTLSSGLHVLSIRSKDTNGQWSITRNQYLYKFPLAVNNNVLPAITQLEYFIDTDPGFGNAINVPITSDSIINGFVFNIPLTSLSSGLHSLYLRSKDANGQWSITRNQYLYKFPLVANNGIAPSIVKAEYFVDTDPGFGNATNIPLVADSILNDITFLVDTVGMNLGTHALSIRTLDANGKWSLTKNTRFTRDKIKLFIQGYYAGANTMTPTLFNQGQTSLTSITDTITIELRNATSPYSLHESIKTTLNTDGTAKAFFTKGIGSYYIVIKHRNSIETWSSTPVAIGNSTITYDFSTSANKAYGSKQKQLGAGVWGIYSGDINQDDNIDLLDAQIMEDDIETFAFGYKTTDINGDGNVDLVELPIVEGNISNFIFSSHP